MRSPIIQELHNGSLVPALLDVKLQRSRRFFLAGLTRRTARRASAVPGWLLQVVGFHQRHTHRAPFSSDYGGIISGGQTETKR